MSSAAKRLGERGEDAAAAYLERAGMIIVERNWRCPAGEIDLVALEDEDIVLCEVKTRRSTAKGSAEDAVTPAKQKRYLKLAQAYAQHSGHHDVSIRFDVITITVIAADRALLRHHRAAFVPEAE